MAFELCGAVHTIARGRECRCAVSVMASMNLIENSNSLPAVVASAGSRNVQSGVAVEIMADRVYGRWVTTACGGSGWLREESQGQ